MFELIIALSKFLLIPVLLILRYYGLKFYAVYKTFKHPDISDEKIKYITHMISKDRAHFFRNNFFLILYYLGTCIQKIYNYGTYILWRKGALSTLPVKDLCLTFVLYPTIALAIAIESRNSLVDYYTTKRCRVGSLLLRDTFLYFRCSLH